MISIHLASEKKTEKKSPIEPSIKAVRFYSSTIFINHRQVYVVSSENRIEHHTYGHYNFQQSTSSDLNTVTS